MSKKVLIFGGTGFLGRALTEVFLKKNPGRLGIVSRQPNNPFYKYQGNQVEILTQDLIQINEASLEKMIMPYDLVINCTGQITSPIQDCLRLNSTGIRTLATAVKNTNKFLIQLSTVGVYGSGEIADETSPLNPETAYSVAKAMADLTIQSILSPQEFLIIRLSNLYGNNQPKGIFSYLLKSAQTDKKLEFNNRGDLLRYFLNTIDCAEIIWELIHAKAQGIINLLGPEKLTVKELIGLAEKTLAISYQVKFSEQAAYDNMGMISDKKLKEIVKLNYSRSVSSSLLENFQSTTTERL